MGQLIPAEHRALVEEHGRRLSHLGEKGTRLYALGRKEAIVLKPNATFHEVAIHTAVLATFRHKVGALLEDAVVKDEEAKRAQSNEYLFLREAMSGLHERATVQLRRAKRALDMLAEKELRTQRKKR